MSRSLIIKPKDQAPGANPFKVLQASFDNTLLDTVSGSSFSRIFGSGDTFFTPGAMGASKGLRGNFSRYQFHTGQDTVFDFDFTVEVWFQFTGGMGTQRTIHAMIDIGDIEIAGQTTAGGGASGLGLYPQLDWDNGSNSAIVAFNTWHHLALTRKDATVRWFIDGQQRASGTSTAQMGGTDVFLFNASNSNSDNQVLSNLRITNGLALYVANFTVPSSYI